MTLFILELRRSHACQRVCRPRYGRRLLGRVLVEACLKGGASKVYSVVHDARDLDLPAGILIHLDLSDQRSAQTAAARCAGVAILNNNAGPEAANSAPLEGTEDR
jgi:NAD(P)-dependent dehydrogenase (short-subunit alcohol dehydrogenase family)